MALSSGIKESEKNIFFRIKSSFTSFLFKRANSGVIACEDLLSQEVDKYSYKFLGEELCDNLECYKVERVPLYDNSGYTKQIIWWDKEEFRIQQIEFYDRKNSLLKTLVYSDYSQYLDNYWRARLLSMQNHQTGKSTDLVFEKWEFNLGQKENFYTPNKLKRER